MTILSLSLSLSHTHTLSVFDDCTDSRSASGSKGVVGSSSQSSAGVVASTSSDAMAVEGKSRHPQPTPPLDDGKDNIRYFCTLHNVIR